MNKPELLAPAGSVDCLKAAILAGADAVYLAGKRFGARAFASNFDEENLKWARKVTKAQNKKLYITLNTIVFEHEWNLLNNSLDFLEELQPDSLIIQDLGVAVELRKRNSKIPLHLSTQGAWFGQGGKEELKELGITRVILPRETSRDEIADIVKNNPFEIEVFVHGAMCYSISGRCFWSAALGTRSGNRGTCAQPCRKEYCLENTKSSNCIFSPKDLRLIDEIKPLINTGITSLKIEGRMKSPEYVYQVVKAYRKAIDGEKADKQILDEVFSRASSTGFFLGIQKPTIWKTGNNAGREGLIVAYTTGKTHNGLIQLELKNNINAGDGVFWYDKNERKGARITFVQNDNKDKKYIWTRGLPHTLPANTEIRRTSCNNEGNWEEKWDKSMERFPLDLYFSGCEGSPLSLYLSFNNREIHLVTEELLQKANQIGLDEGPLQEKFNVIGEDYKIQNCNVKNLENKLHISASELKKLKRNLSESLNILAFSNQPSHPKSQPNKLQLPQIKYFDEPNSNNSLKSRLRLWNQIEILTSKLSCNSIVVPWYQREKVNKNYKGEIAYWLPPILNSKQFNDIFNELKKLKSGIFLCFGWEVFKLSKLLPNLKFELDWCFNVANLNALEYLQTKGINAVLSKEWKTEDIPQNLNAYRSNFSWNPLVSYTRFNGAIQQNKEVTNSHKDNFFTLSIGNGVTAMFLENSFIKLPKISAPLQIDVAISPKENPIQVINNLNRTNNI